MKLTRYILFLLLGLMFTGISYGQFLNPEAEYTKLVAGSVFRDTISSKFPPAVAQNPSGFQCVITSLGSNRYEIKATPLNFSTGVVFIPVQYTETTTKLRYIKFYIDYVESIIKANTDYISVSSNETVTIDVLSNDNSTAGPIELVSVNNVQVGTASVDNGYITYTAPSNLVQDVIIYSIKDGLGSQVTGKVVISADDIATEALDTVSFSIINLHKQELVLANSSFGIVSTDQPSKGVLTHISANIWSYKPNEGSVGLDDFSFTDADGNVVMVLAKIINLPPNRSSVRDDKFYTPVNTPLTFNVFDNDLSSSFPISGYSNGIVYQSAGTFSYTPPQGYSGEKTFTYTVNYGGGNTYTGKIKIYIGNYMPKQDLDYTFHTLAGAPFALEYNVPIEGYAFDVVDQPLFGTLEIFNTETSLELSCNSVNNNSIILYTPDNGYYGLDSFSIEYCVADTCFIYKLTANVHQNINDQCPCTGDDCVYKGDMNGDGRVSMSDILTLGKYLGANGPERNDANYGYNAGQFADSWGQSQANGRDYNKLDANGDGRVSKEDLSELDVQYGSYNNLVPNEVLSVKDFPFYLVPNATVLDSGDVLILDIYYGTETKPVINGVGVAFQLNLPANVVDSASVQGFFDQNGWFANNGATLQLIKQPQDGRIHAGFTKTGLIVEDEIIGFIPASSGNAELIVEDEIIGFKPGVSGHGKLGQVQMIVEDEIIGFKSSDEFIYATITLEGTEMLGGDGEMFSVPPSEITIKIRKDKKIAIPTEDKLMVYPNPVQNIVNLHFNGHNIIKGYRVVDIMGSTITVNNNIEQQSTSIDVSTFPTGHYSIQVITTDGVITKKIEVINE